jgi:hypothetical protein
MFPVPVFAAPAPVPIQMLLLARIPVPAPIAIVLLALVPAPAPRRVDPRHCVNPILPGPTLFPIKVDSLVFVTPAAVVNPIATVFVTFDISPPAP